MKSNFTLGLLLLVVPAGLHASAPSEVPPLRQVSQFVQQLAENAGFSDEDAVQAASFILEKLEGPKPKEAKLSCRISDSKPGSVVIIVGYDFGLKGVSYEVEFERGDVQKGERWAYFKSLKHIQSE